MRKFITKVARFIAAIFAFFFIISTALALILSVINRQGFKADLYKTALAEQDVYKDLPEIIGVALTSNNLSDPCLQNPLICQIEGASPELQTCLMNALGQQVYEEIGNGQRNPSAAELQLSQPCLDLYGSDQTTSRQSGTENSESGSGMPFFFQILTAEDWQFIISNLLPPEDLKTMTDGTLDQLFAYLDGKTDKVTVSLVKIRERLAGQAGADLITHLMNSQLPCTLQELAQIISGIFEGSVVLCKPPEVMASLEIAVLQNLLKTAAAQIPDTAFLISSPSVITPPSGTGPLGATPIATLLTIRLYLRLSPLIPLIFLLLVTLFAVRSIKSWMRWWGIPILISGVLTLGLGFSMLLVINSIWTNYIVPRIPPFFPPNIVVLGQALVRSILGKITGQIILWAIIILAIGLAAWIGSYYVKVNTNPVESPAPPTPAA